MKRTRNGSIWPRFNPIGAQWSCDTLRHWLGKRITVRSNGKRRYARIIEARLDGNMNFLAWGAKMLRTGNRIVVQDAA